MPLVEFAAEMKKDMLAQEHYPPPFPSQWKYQDKLF